MHFFFQEIQIQQKLAEFVKPRKNLYFESELGFSKSTLSSSIFSPSCPPRNSLLTRTPTDERKPPFQKIRKDFRIPNKRGELLACSLYQSPLRTQNYLTSLQSTAIVFAHGSSGNRLEGVRIVEQISCEIGLDLCSFDFSGCGLSEGNFITLGLKEEEDLECVISYLITKAQYKKFILIGRSMGAVTALLFCSLRNKQAIHSILGIIIDSAFYSLKQLVYDMAKDKLSFLGTFLTDLSLPYLRDLLKKMLDGYDIFTLEMKSHAQIVSCNPSIQRKKSSISSKPIPALFMYSNEDTLVLPNHAHLLLEAYTNSSSFFEFSGDHNSQRGQDYYQRIRKFINRILLTNGIPLSGFEEEQDKSLQKCVDVTKNLSDVDIELTKIMNPFFNQSDREAFAMSVLGIPTEESQSFLVNSTSLDPISNQPNKCSSPVRDLLSNEAFVPKQPYDIQNACFDKLAKKPDEKQFSLPFRNSNIEPSSNLYNTSFQSQKQEIDGISSPQHKSNNIMLQKTISPEHGYPTLKAKSEIIRIQSTQQFTLNSNSIPRYASFICLRIKQKQKLSQSLFNFPQLYHRVGYKSTYVRRTHDPIIKPNITVGLSQNSSNATNCLIDHTTNSSHLNTAHVSSNPVDYSEGFRKKRVRLLNDQDGNSKTPQARSNHFNSQSNLSLCQSEGLYKCWG